MGTIISLELGGLQLFWAKNHRGLDFGALFQEGDRLAVRSDQINYEYFQEQKEDPTTMEMAFVRKLKYIVPRLDLLGFTLEQARSVYDSWMMQEEEEEEEEEDQEEDGEEIELTVSIEGLHLLKPLSFEEFCEFANRHAIIDLDDTYFPNGTERRGRFVNDEETINRINHSFGHNDLSCSERSYFGDIINILHPYLMLRILADKTVNLETDVIWQYGPLVEAGWAEIAEFTPLARRTETFLIATEGSSDVHILSHAFRLLRPEIVDFFRFIDVSERHPFSGTGNLLKFAEGLAKIDVQNQTVFLFDNDAEGTEAFNKLAVLTLPSNMRTMLLPSMDAFRSFPARGPQGDHEADINGRAAAIECYLDHRHDNYPPPRVIWTNYRKETDTYQGALEYKESYMKVFLKLTRESLVATEYDTSKIEKVLDALVEQCASLAEGELAARLAALDC